MPQNSETTAKYDHAAPRWGDKMRSLGYYNAYLGFLSHPDFRPEKQARVIDVGAGTAAFSEAWVAVNGAPADLLLIDSSPAMLQRGRAAIERYNMKPRTALCRLEDTAKYGPADEILAAHIIEHIPNPVFALDCLRSLVRPGGRLRLVVSKPHWCNAIVWMQWRHRCYTPEKIRELAAKQGLELEAEYAFPHGPPSRTSWGYIIRRRM